MDNDNEESLKPTSYRIKINVTNCADPDEVTVKLADNVTFVIRKFEMEDRDMKYNDYQQRQQFYDINRFVRRNVKLDDINLYEIAKDNKHLEFDIAFSKLDYVNGQWIGTVGVFVMILDNIVITVNTSDLIPYGKMGLLKYDYNGEEVYLLCDTMMMKLPKDRSIKIGVKLVFPSSDGQLFQSNRKVFNFYSLYTANFIYMI